MFKLLLIKNWSCFRKHEPAFISRSSFLFLFPSTFRGVYAVVFHTSKEDIKLLLIGLIIVNVLSEL